MVLNLVKVKIKDTFNENPEKFCKYQIILKRRYYCIKKVACGKCDENFYARCTKFSPCDSVFLSMPCFK